LQLQTDAEQGLNHALVKLVGDALALGYHGQPT
jgi:hypothetical protein